MTPSALNADYLEDATGLQSSGVVPVIETRRLILRAHRFEDFEACFRLWNDAEVSRSLLQGKGSPNQEVWFRMLRYSGMWSMLGFGYFAVLEKASGQFVGEVGFANFMRATEPSLGDDPEVGWAMLSEASGQGFASEAVAGALTWFDRAFPRRRSFCVIGLQNIRSAGVAVKNGYTEQGRCMLGDIELAVFERAPRDGSDIGGVHHAS